MTYVKLIFTCVLLFSGFLSRANPDGLIKQIEKGLDLRDQDIVVRLSRKLEKISSEKAQVHFYFAKGYLFLGKEGVILYDSSLYFVEKVLKETVPSDELHFEANLFKVHALLGKGNYKECVKLIQQLQRTTVVKQSPEKSFLLDVELFLLYTRISDLTSASKLVQSIKTSPESIDKLNLGKSYMALGRYYLSDGKLEDSRRYFEKALHEFKPISICNTSDAMHLLAQVEKEKGNIDGAMRIYNKLLHFEDHENYRHGYILTLLIACETTLIDKTNQEKMLENVNKAYRYAFKLNNKLRLLQAEMNMGFYYKQTNQNEQAIPHFKVAMDIANQIGEYYWSRSASRFLVEIYKSKGDFKNAFEFQKENSVANQKLQESNQTKEADLVRNVHLMYTYRHEMEQSEYALERKQVHLIIWITISIATIGISILLLLLYIRQKRHNLFLTEKALKESERKIQLIQPIDMKEPKEIISEEKTEARQSLDEAIYLDLQQKLLDFIEAKGFLEPECSLSSLAKEFNTNTAYLSKYINEILNTSFNQLINEYRIVDFIERVKVDKEGRKTFTLDHLASLSGFSSKSTFIRAFKKQTGLAPSVFLKNLEELN